MFARLRQLARRVHRKIAVYRCALKHPRTPRLARWLPWIALAYLCLPFDIVPDWFPVLGQLDDVVIVSALVRMAFRLIPRDVIAESRAAADDLSSSADRPNTGATTCPSTLTRSSN